MDERYQSPSPTANRRPRESDYKNPSAWENTLPGALGIPAPATLFALGFVGYFLSRLDIRDGNGQRP